MSKVVVSIGDKEYLSPKEACAYMGIGKNTLENWKKKGLRYIKIERKTYISKSHIDEFLREYVL